MIGRGRTDEGRAFEVVRRSALRGCALALAGLIGITAFGGSSAVMAQAGRRRQPPPPPKVEEKHTPPTEEKPAAPTVKKGAEIAEELTIPEQATTRVRLRNGLTLIVRERYRFPLVGIAVVVKTERSGQPAGIARLVGRLLFRGTSARPGLRALEELRALGGELIVEEQADHTLFRMTVPPELIRRVLDLFADGLQHPSFEEAAVRQEIERLLQEERVRSDRPELFARDRAHALARGESLLLEQESALRALSREAIADFHRQYYRGERMVIALVGAVNTPDIVADVQRLFGDLPYVERKAEPSPQAQASGESRSEEVKASEMKASAPGAQENASSAAPSSSLRYGEDRGDLLPAIMTFWHEVPDGIISGDRKGDWPLLLRLLTTVLAQGRASRLALGVRETRRVAAEVKAQPVIGERRGALLVQWRVDPAERERLLLAYVEEVEKLRRLRLSPGELQRARAFLERWWLERTMTYVGEATELALEEAASGDFRRADHFVARLAEITAEQLRAFAERCLDIGQMTLHAYLPRSITGSADAAGIMARIVAHVPGVKEREIAPERVGQSPEVPTMPHGERRAHEGEGEAIVFSLQPEPLRDFSVFEGPRAFVREDRSRPLLSIGVFFQGGRQQETAATAGLTELMLRAILRGTRGRASLSAAEVAMRLEQLGADIALVNTPDFFGYVLTVLSRNQDSALRLLVELLERPALADEEIRLEQARLLWEIRARRVDPIERARDLAVRALYGDMPYGRSPLGEEESVRALTPEQVRGWYASTIARQFPLVLIVGDTDGSALISTIVAREIRRQDVSRAFQVTLPKPLTETRSLSEEIGQRAIVQTWAWLGPSSLSDDEPALDVLRAHLAGWGSELWRALQGASASLVEVSVESRRLGGRIALTIAVAPEQMASVRQLVEQEIARLAREPLGAEVVQRAIQRALVERAALFEDHTVLVLAYARAFFATARPQLIEQQTSKLGAVTAADLQRVAATYLPVARVAIGLAHVRPRSSRP
ncbi:MAG: insulinase family protein [Blastocatellia bacterium]|nr:insulinase family protein [Blastocatellia bacterium]MDW8257649.1 insulinase family protein [Acidobacteriota bacterium]